VRKEGKARREGESSRGLVLSLLLLIGVGGVDSDLMESNESERKKAEGRRVSRLKQEGERMWEDKSEKDRTNLLVILLKSSEILSSLGELKNEKCRHKGVSSSRLDLQTKRSQS